MNTHTEEKIFVDYLATSTLAVVALGYKDIIKTYSEEHWSTLKEELIAKGNDFLFMNDDCAYFGVEAGDTPHEIINIHWDEMVKSLDCVDRGEDDD
jgi:hypothetical protein